MSVEYDWIEITNRLNKLLRLECTVIGIKGFEHVSDLDQIPKLRRPKHIHTPCQIVGQAIQSGFTMGFTKADIATRNCNSVIGLEEQSEEWLAESVKLLTNVWWETKEDVLEHQKSLTAIPKVKYEALVVSPLVSGRIQPDVCLITAAPGAIFMLLSGYLHKKYQAIDIQLVGESSCSMTWVKTLYTGEIGLSTPCFAEMRYGGFSKDSMILSMQPKDLIKALEGLEDLSKVGLRYPIPSYSAVMDVREGLGKSYDIK